MRSHSAGRAGASEDTVSASGRDVHRWLLVGCHVSAAFKGHGTCPSDSQYYHRAAVAVAVAVASPMHRHIGVRDSDERLRLIEKKKGPERTRTGPNDFEGRYVFSSTPDKREHIFPSFFFFSKNVSQDTKERPVEFHRIQLIRRGKRDARDRN